MPRKEINYANTMIYKIVCNDIKIIDVYVGSTTNFIKRKQQHKSMCNNPNSTSYSSLVYETIRANGGWVNWSMIEIVKISCVDGNEARRVERSYIESLGATLNSIRPIVSAEEAKTWISKYDAEYYQTHKSEKAEYNKTHKSEKAEYYQTNKAEIAEYYIAYRQTNKAEIAKKKAEYYQTNKAEIAKKKAEYRQTHKAEINAKRREKYALSKSINI